MNNTKGLKICFSLLAIIVLCTCYIGCLLTYNDFAHADYEDILLDSNVLVNFNQLISNNFINTTTSSEFTTIYNTSSFTLINEHKYYIRGTNNGTTAYALCTGSGWSNYHSLCVFNAGGYTDTIYTATQNRNGLQIYRDSGSVNIINLNMYDLTQLFGVGNEPNLQQCQDLFVADYYNYNTGTAISLNGLNAYADGVNSVYNSLKKVFDTTYIINNAQPYYQKFTNSEIHYYSVDEPYDRLIDDFVFFNACYIPFGFTLDAGSFVYLYSTLFGQYAFNDSSRLGLYSLDVSNNLILLDIFEGGGLTLDKDYYLERASVGLVLQNLTDTNYLYNALDFTITYQANNVTQLVADAYDSGYSKGLESLKSYYSVGGVGYNAIYQAGYQAYPQDDHFTFQKLISSVIDVPIQAFTNLFDYDILGVNMKTFYLSIFTLCVIITIIRLVL